MGFFLSLKKAFVRNLIIDLPTSSSVSPEISAHCIIQPVTTQNGLRNHKKKSQLDFV
jgi:hypothetical protein